MKFPLFSSRTHTHVAFTPVAPAPATQVRFTDLANLRDYCKAQLDAVEGFTLPPHILEYMHQRSSETDAMKQTPSHWVQFTQFKRVMLDTLQQLHQDSGLSGGFEQSQWCTLAERLGLLKGAGNRKPLGIDLVAFYTSTCTDLQKITKAFALMRQHPQEFSQESRDRVETQIRELANKLNVCGPGTSQNIETALRNTLLVVSPPEFSAQFAAKRLEIARQIFVEFAAKHMQHEFKPVANEIHMVNTLQNSYANRFKLPVVDDPHANTRYTWLAPQARRELEQTLEHFLHPEHIASELGQQFLQQVKASQTNPNSGVTPSSPDYPKLCRELELQKPILGEVHPSWVCDVDPDIGTVGWKSNTTLLAAHALEEMRKQSNVDEPNMPATQSFAWSKHNTLQVGKRLVWCEEKTGAHRQVTETGLEQLESDVLQQWTKTKPSDPKALAVIAECLRNNPELPFANLNEIPAWELQAELKLAICWAGLKALPKPTPQIKALIDNLSKDISYKALTSLLASQHADHLSEPAIQACLRYPEIVPSGKPIDEKLLPVTIADIVVGLDSNLTTPRPVGNAKAFEQALKIVLQQDVPSERANRICKAAVRAGAEQLECLKTHTNWLNAQMPQTLVEEPSLFGGASKATISYLLNEIAQTSLQPKLPGTVLIKLSENPWLTEQDRLSIVETLRAKELMDPLQDSDIKTLVETALAIDQVQPAVHLLPLLTKQALAEELTRIVSTQTAFVISAVLKEISQISLQSKLPITVLFKLSENPFLTEQDRLIIVETLAAKELMEPPQGEGVKSLVQMTLDSNDVFSAPRLFPLLPKQALTEELTRIVSTQPELLRLGHHQGIWWYEFFDLLQKFGADFKKADSRLLIQMMKEQESHTIQALNTLQVDPNKVPPDERSALIYAIEEGLEVAVHELLKHGANPLASHNGTTALDMALSKVPDSPQMFDVAVKMLQRIIGITKRDRQGYTLLHHAVLAANQQAALLKKPLTNTTENQQEFERALTKLKATAIATYRTNMRSSLAHRGKTAMHLAYKGGNARVIEALEAGGASNQVRDYKLRLPSRLIPRNV